MRRLLHKYGLRWLAGLVFTLAAAATALHVLPATLVDRIDVFAYDMRMRLEKAELDPRIVIIDIDERSLAEVGRWPWSRDTVARLIDRLGEHYHARTIAFDVIFSEADTSSGYATLEALARKELRDVDGFGERIRALKPRFDYDARMAESLRDRPTILGYYLSNEATAVSKGQLPPPAFSISHLKGRDIESPVYRAYSGNLDALQGAARAGGFMNPTPDSDGAIRRLPLLARVGDNYYESLALATARVGLGASVVRPVFFSSDDMLFSTELSREYGALKAIRMNSKPQTTVVPLERNLTALVNFRGPGGPQGGRFRYVSAVDVLTGAAPMEHLADAIMLVGTTSAGLKDLRATPVNIDYPGVELHANIIASILDADFKQQPDFSIAIELFQIAAIGLALGLLLPVLTPAWAILMSLLAAAVLIGWNVAMYHVLDWVVPLAAAMLLIGALSVFNLAWGYLFEYRKGRAMVNLFGEYVAPELVAEMAANPQSYSMEGESRELTVLFCDVRGFTTISEGLDPNALREYINLYLTAMSEDIRGNRGTLDKYIGDAVMAFWGAPVHLPDHASRAVATALKMQQTARQLNAGFIARNWPPLKIGIGLNTGEMRVGDMGSRIRRAYTVMGDAVNLSSRLEGITKVYGAGVAVGPATRDAAPEFAYRELDRVRVKGKNQPVPIFEPLCHQDQLDEEAGEELAQWHAALELVRGQHWDDAEAALRALLKRHPDDGLYRLYIERVAYYRAHPPRDDWDGVTTFESK
ncbi:adenylate/guanylate cyclase domain-containing protein [Noviherbaspirillum sp. CPCC 100848]|uniref:Adenylate/guanylate cyclase domain-containing protein n=1 Tax=Noviherbaspirillum album TaxID=3080276 RepID=A0ABU6J4N7_9BURK|nr:adenylate/guanylate cyclase domain-containing protein [Noviherbaspirillum sp. CPCC 100848]MEC4718592.1 adenylate/guanylate cyclase domain-containing protein [Noviherbaspirillum sp. CPCC 100848]